MLTRVNDHKLMLPIGATVETMMFDVVMYRGCEIFTFEFPCQNVIVATENGDLAFDTFEEAITAIEGV